MITSEKFCLKWNDFQNNISEAFGNIREDNHFADVTLACEDGKQVEAHKVILAASSPFFQNLLTKNKHHHPLIYMRGIKSEDLFAIVDFLYNGEANIYQENLDRFLVIAEELKLKGLAEGEQETKPEETFKPSPQNKIVIKNEYIPKLDPKKSNTVVFESNTDFPTAQDNTTVLADSKVAIELNTLDVQIKSMMILGENVISNGTKSLVRASVCQVCGKEGLSVNIKAHIEANHIEGISHSCNICEKTFRYTCN